MITIEGVDLPAPSSYLTSQQDFTKILRNARGTMIGEFISRKAKIEMSWNFITEDNMSLILNAIDPLFFNVKYWDSKTKAYRTSLFYKGDRTSPLLDRLSDVNRYKDFAFNIIER
jgi:hypothetical protein